MTRLIFALLLTCLVVAALACGSDSSSEGDGAAPQSAPAVSSEEDSGDGEKKVEQSSAGDSGGGEHSSSSEDDDSGDSDSDGGGSGQSGASDEDDSDGGGSGQSGASDEDDSDDSGSGQSGASDDGGSDDDDTVSRENPGLTGQAFDASRNEALAGAQPINAVTWTTEPTVSFGALEAEGVLQQGAILFDPLVEGEGAAFIVYFKGVPEPLLLLLPDLGPMSMWESNYTIAPAEQEIEGANFSIRAYSPLFMDVGPGDLEMRVFGYDSEGADAYLAVQPVTVQ